jgi:4-hydroxy-tetrahydrodipicolinate reductase
MIKIIMHGCNGHMGQVISGLVAQDPDAEIVAGIDMLDNRPNPYPVFTSLAARSEERV